VVFATLGADPTQAIEDPTAMFWIDKETRIILRERITVDTKASEDGRSVQRTFEYVFTGVTLSPALAGDEFVFMPPQENESQTVGTSVSAGQTSRYGTGEPLAGARLLGPARDVSVVDPPTVLSTVEPEYSDEGTRIRLSGRVLVGVIVGADGRPASLTILKSLGFGLDEAALDAVSKWRFRPGTRNGQPLPVIAQVEVNFRFETPKGAWFVQTAVYDAEEGATAPYLEQAFFPIAKSSGEPCSVALTVPLDETGKLGEIQLSSASRRECWVDLVAAVRKWKFRPATKGGAPVASSLTMELAQ
jgi:TonB family protein